MNQLALIKMAQAERTAIVTQVLSNHRGEARGIHVDALAEKCGVSERDVRHAVTAMREDGIAVCAHPTTGYYIAASAEELEQCCQFLRSRALKSLMLEARLRNVSLPDLLGQLHLPT